MDPNVLQGLPEKVMASTGVDALIHALEAYTCKAASPVTDAFALYAIASSIGANIREAVYQRTKGLLRSHDAGKHPGGRGVRLL